jgi:hypothetical protein
VTVQVVDWQVVIKSDATSNNNGVEGMLSQFKLDLCYCHRLSTCISCVLWKQTRVVGGVKQSTTYFFYEKSKLVFDMIDDVKALVTYMKKTLLNKKLNNKMKHDVAMRFDGLLIMLQSVAVELATSIELLKKRKQEECAECIIKPLLIELIRLLHYFKLTSKSLEPFLTATIHLVGMWFAKLTAHLQPRIEPVTVDIADDEKVTIAADSDKIGLIKVLLLDQLKEKYFLKLLHAAVAYLDPLQKNRLLDCGFTQKLIDHGLLYLKDIMRKVGPPKQIAMFKSGDKCPLPAKKNRAKKLHTVFVHAGPSRDDNNDDSSESNGDHEQGKAAQFEALIEHELASYRLLKVDKSDKKVVLQEDTRERARQNGKVKHDVGILPWWKIKSANFPILVRTARAILCIPALSSMPKCTFSSAGNTWTNKRNALKPNMLNALFYLCFNQDLDRSQ